MIITLNKKEIVDQFLKPVSRVSEECSLSIASDSVSTLVNNDDGVVLYSKIKTDTGLKSDESVSLNIKNVRKLIKIFDCITEDIFKLTVSDNACVISYKSKAVSFKLHLVLDGMISRCPASLNKISSLTFDSDFILTSAKIDEILKGSVFSADIGKVYFYTKDDSVYAELTDKANQEVDSLTLNISEEYNGDSISTPLPFSIDVLRLVNSTKFENATVKINNTYKVILFEPRDTRAMFKYIVSGYTK